MNSKLPLSYWILLFATLFAWLTIVVGGTVVLKVAEQSKEASHAASV